MTPDLHAALQTARAAYASAVAPGYRACLLCDHHTAAAGSTWPSVCAHPHALSRPVPVEVARAPHGSCGPDANLMTRDGWDYRS